MPAQAPFRHPLESWPGVGPAVAARLVKLGVMRPEDLLFLLPLRVQIDRADGVDDPDRQVPVMETKPKLPRDCQRLNRDDPSNLCGLVEQGG